MNIDDNGNSYAEMQAVPFSHPEVSQVSSDHDIVGENFAQIPVIMSDDDGKEFIVHYTDDRDMENMDEELELGVGNHEDQDRDSSEMRAGHPIPDQERFLPIANVARVMKRMIPSSGKIAKDAKECVQECVSEFISFITSEANDKCMSEKRRTINADDLLEAITNMGFDNYVAPLQLFLERYRAAHKLNSNTTTSAFATGKTYTSLPEHSPPLISNGTSMDTTSHRDLSSRVIVTPSPSLSASNSASNNFQGRATRPLSHQTLHGQELLGNSQTPTTSNGPSSHSSTITTANSAPIVLAGGVSGVSVTALQQQPMQIYIDPASKQHYMAIETEQGMQLYPIQIQTDGPVAYSFAPEVATALTSSNNTGNQTFIMMATGDVDESCTPAITVQPTARLHTSTTNNTTTRHSCEAQRTHGHSDFGARHQNRNTSTPSTYSVPSVQAESVQSRPAQRRPSTATTGAGGKASNGKATAPIKRTRLN